MSLACAHWIVTGEGGGQRELSFCVKRTTITLTQVNLIRTLITLCNTMEPILTKCWISLELTYYERRTVRS